jgi:acetyl esterase/lipase
MKWLHLLALSLALTSSLVAAPEVLRLWPEGMPQPRVETTEAERVDRSSPSPEGFDLRKNITEPRVLVYPGDPAKSTGAACLVVPGGGFGILADEHEGSELCEWFAARGITGFLLRHRCPTNMHVEPNAGPVQDCQRAIIQIKENAERFKIDRAKLGLFGFSAGGQVALVAASNGAYFPMQGITFDHRPAFLMLLYPWRIYDEKTKDLRSDIPAAAHLPPLFLAQAADDGSSHPLGCTLLYQRALANRGLNEIHLYAKGGHGFGMRSSKEKAPCPTDWPLRAEAWLRLAGMIE